MKKWLYILLIFFWTIPSGFAQLKTYTFEEAEKLSKDNPKPFVVFIHTDWCKFCQAMKNTTFKDKIIVEQLNNNFYFISFNAEEKRSVHFNNQKFSYKPTGNAVGVHELAILLGKINNQITYPVICVLNSEYQILFQDTQYRNAKDFELILNKLKQ